MNKRSLILLLPVLLFPASCITQFIPQTHEDKQLLVVEGLITNLPGPNIIKLSKSLPLGSVNSANPVSGCSLTITDDLFNIYNLSETSPGTYVTNPSEFQGSISRFYTLHINTPGPIDNSGEFHSYASNPVEMKPVPVIDSVYYEKVTIEKSTSGSEGIEGCRILLDTHDPTNQCKYYRWEFDETWKIDIPYAVPNKICYVSATSSIINIKNTSVFTDDKIEKYPLYFISNQTDRLKIRYSILVKQYSLNEDEYQYWEKLQNLSEQAGGLYDVIPSAVSSNVFCIDDPNQKVQGYFSVSASTSKRIFIHAHFAGQPDPYSFDRCIADTIFASDPIPPTIGTSAWIIMTNFLPPYKIYTISKGCYDCTVRGTTTPPDFWSDNK
jgi:hypothetical protein